MTVTPVLADFAHGSLDGGTDVSAKRKQNKQNKQITSSPQPERLTNKETRNMATSIPPPPPPLTPAERAFAAFTDQVVAAVTILNSCRVKMDNKFKNHPSNTSGHIIDERIIGNTEPELADYQRANDALLKLITGPTTTVVDPTSKETYEVSHVHVEFRHRDSKNKDHKFKTRQKVPGIFGNDSKISAVAVRGLVRNPNGPHPLTHNYSSKSSSSST